MVERCPIADPSTSRSEPGSSIRWILQETIRFSEIQKETRLGSIVSDSAKYRSQRWRSLRSQTWPCENDPESPDRGNDQRRKLSSQSSWAMVRFDQYRMYR